MSRENIEKMRQASLTEPAWQLLGIKLEEISDGYAKVILKPKPEFRNFIGTIHGGVIMTLADSAFGYALNSLHYPTVAAQFNTHFLNPAAPGDDLEAECHVLKAGKRIVTAEIYVKDKGGKIIARATGTGVPLEQE
jgi:acyl-CoA thioesterase